MNGLPILTYHSLHAPGDSYAENDHVALASDLETLHKLGFECVSLSEIADRVIAGDREWLESGHKVGLSFDDGVNHDFIDFVHPDIPTLKSFHTILAEFNQKHRLKWRTSFRATSFVIASQDATRILDQTCIAGRGDWHDGWWLQAAQSGLIQIGNHSWDHLHGTLPRVFHSRDARDDFSQVDNEEDAQDQIHNAEIYIRSVIGQQHATGLFAYPDGRRHAFLTERYLPEQDLIRAAFTTDGRPVTAADNRWEIPRYTCGDHWNSAESLRVLLKS